MNEGRYFETRHKLVIVNRTIEIVDAYAPLLFPVIFLLFFFSISFTKVRNDRKIINEETINKFRNDQYSRKMKRSFVKYIRKFSVQIYGVRRNILRRTLRWLLTFVRFASRNEGQKRSNFSVIREFRSVSGKRVPTTDDYSFPKLPVFRFLCFVYCPTFFLPFGNDFHSKGRPLLLRFIIVRMFVV